MHCRKLFLKANRRYMRLLGGSPKHEFLKGEEEVEEEILKSNESATSLHTHSVLKQQNCVFIVTHMKIKCRLQKSKDAIPHNRLIPYEIEQLNCVEVEILTAVLMNTVVLSSLQVMELTPIA
jgi:hypothetical protein